MKEVLIRYDNRFEDFFNKLQGCQTLVSMVFCIWGELRLIGVWMLEEELQRRALEPEQWPNCEHCGKKLHSKGLRARQILTLFGLVTWKRRIGRCPDGCKGSHIAPMDKRLGIDKGQRTSAEVKWMGCSLVIFVPYQLAIVLLQQMTGLYLSADTLWCWTQTVGQTLCAQTQKDLATLADGTAIPEEALSDELANAPMVVGADGVLVPFRPKAGSPAGKTVWREVKVGIIARLMQRTTRTHKTVTVLKQRRLVAFLGPIKQFTSFLELELLKQGLLHAVRVVWISDGGTGYWGVFKEVLQPFKATSILDFYHAAQNLCKAAKVWLDGRTVACRTWFESRRHLLRHGEEAKVLTELEELLQSKQLSDSARKAIQNIYHYLQQHENHIHYQQFKEDGLPIGSGIVESACKWLIQQRFKGVGMRWSEDGFNRLLYVRGAWVNQRFDAVFPLADFRSPR